MGTVLSDIMNETGASRMQIRYARQQLGVEILTPEEIDRLKAHLSTRRGWGAGQRKPGKLDAVSAEELRVRHEHGESPKTLQQEFGISSGHFYNVIHGRVWPRRNDGTDDRAVESVLHRGHV